MAQHPEDRPDFPTKDKAFEFCRSCKKERLVPHCPDGGCPWCKNCGPPVKE